MMQKNCAMSDVTKSTLVKQHLMEARSCLVQRDSANHNEANACQVGEHPRVD
jgi:hypothetical protein